MQARRRESSESAQLSDEELLGQLVEKFNNYKANAAIKKWQLSPVSKPQSHVTTSFITTSFPPLF